MSILGGSKGNANAQPKPRPSLPPMPPVPPAPRPSADVREMPPEVQEWAAAQSAIWRENQQLKEEVRQLRNALEVATKTIEDKDRAIAFERQRVHDSDRWKEVCQRYAVEINKGIHDGLAMIEKAHQSAMDLARQRPLDKLEQAVDDALTTAREVQDGSPDDPVRGLLQRTETAGQRADG